MKQGKPAGCQERRCWIECLALLMGEEGEEGEHRHSITFAVAVAVGDVGDDGDNDGGSVRNNGLKETGKQVTEREKPARQ